MQVVYFLISLIEIILTFIIVSLLRKGTRAIKNANIKVNSNIKKFEDIYEIITKILNLSAKFFDFYKNYKASIKEINHLFKAIISVKKIIDTYSFLSSITTIKKLGFLIFLKKMIFKKH